MTARRFAGLAVAAIAAVLMTPATARSDTPALVISRTPPPDLESLRAGQISTDNRINEFRQRDPGDGVPVSRSTTAFVSYDEKSLWVAFVCEDEPQQVRAHLARREATTGDDQVIVYIDTFRDGQRAYFFAVNPYGVQRDGIFSESQGDDDSFDTVWHSEGTLTESGYVVRIQIPFKSLRFSNASEQAWGIALGRIIPRHNEESYWPYITRRVQGFVQQFALATGLEHISPGRNLQFIPYGMSTAARYLDSDASAGAAVSSQRELRGGLDSKIVLHDAFALDLALNPDFSQVESDEPQVTINQRFEVFFPERRPFFLENAGFFQTPVLLFFSRRIADPQLGARVTGKAGRWALGGLMADDRAPGLSVGRDDPQRGRRSVDRVMSLRRELGQQSSVGILATSREFGARSNRVVSVDTRLELNRNWVLSGQAMHSTTQGLDGGTTRGPGALLELTCDGRHFGYMGRYTDLSPGFQSDLGYVKRVDIRQIEQEAQYRWRPRESPIVKYGPTLTALWNQDRGGQLQDWSIEGQFKIDFVRDTKVEVGHARSFEVFEQIGFRKQMTTVTASTAWLKSLRAWAAYQQGTDINFDPAPGLVPFLADARQTELGVTLRPSARLTFEQTYIDNRLDARSGFSPVLPDSARSAFVNRLARSKVNYQFTRPLSLRWILDYAAVDPNESLVALERERRLQVDVLLTYLLNPGTSLFAGYTDREENLMAGPAGRRALLRTNALTNTGRQFFVKVSYLWRM